MYNKIGENRLVSAAKLLFHDFPLSPEHSLDKAEIACVVPNQLLESVGELGEFNLLTSKELKVLIIVSLSLYIF